ncbi:hypothetical protein BDY21DRAFT_177586 [Lineolata rhizophorae]|uniref:Uncharacterized protein n=1 Tax=Lineolata rhizophorae TaxID=578093 RepID=A0A6A6P7J0_9PEZI|nr:hypothetical protein BDY21DRAFT_177586 [Lineolata rhizophorae]
MCVRCPACRLSSDITLPVFSLSPSPSLRLSRRLFFFFSHYRLRASIGHVPLPAEALSFLSHQGGPTRHCVPRQQASGGPRRGRAGSGCETPLDGAAVAQEVRGCSAELWVDGKDAESDGARESQSGASRAAPPPSQPGGCASPAMPSWAPGSARPWRPALTACPACA